MTVKGWFIDPALRLNTIRFGDGALLNLATLASLAVAPIFGTAGDGGVQ